METPFANSEKNIVLIGMPGVGKSTAGVLLAKRLLWDFLDTDVYIQAQEGRRLQEILDHDGLEAFRQIEEAYILTVDCRRTVIATGGSVVYSVAAVEHLKKHGVVVYLDLDLEDIMRRITNLGSRGVAMAPGMTLARLYEERVPLYQCHADIVVDCDGLGHEDVVSATVAALKAWGFNP